MTKRIVPEIDEALCTLCGDCIASCPEGAVHLSSQKIIIDEDACDYCGDCEDLCPAGAIALPFEIILVPPNDSPGD